MRSKRVGNSQIGISAVPPPTCRQAPTRAGRQVIARMAWPPPRLLFDRHALANGGWLGRRIFARQRLDVGHRDAGDLGNAFGRIVRGARLQLLEAERVFLHVIVIDQPLGDDDVHHAQRERAVGARLDGHVPVRLFGGARAHGVDDHDLGTLLLRFEDERPRVQVGADHVHPPHDDVLRVGKALEVQSTGWAHGHDPGCRRSGLAIGFFRHRGPQAVEERVPGREPVERALMAEIGVRHDRLRTVGRGDVGPAALDFRERVVP